ncbi:hypothetical protein DM02DRAFT_611464 [Periconia macrospinosa]|uniref:Uncharacterized protein n=1 Tax=Periconia macrospinosa TaxID=97972 RepID=A0A2V1E1I8_9PLEO|nr:hypothetical protein DM02DRAFT_611464 [Periconia macrospinosa]
MTSTVARSAHMSSTSSLLSSMKDKSLMMNATMLSSDPPTPSSSIHSLQDTLTEAEQRGRLKRRRRMSSHSPPRAPSPSRGHERDSGSRHRHHHRKHHRADSSCSLTPSAEVLERKNRRRSDAEPDHTLRGRARNRSQSRSRRAISEGEDDGDASSDEERWVRGGRKRDVPPSRARLLGQDGDAIDREMRRQRSLRNMYEHSKYGKTSPKGGSVDIDTRKGSPGQDENRSPSSGVPDA